MNPLFNQLAPMQSGNIVQQIQNFKKSLSGDPQQIVQGMLNSGKITQSQFNQYAQQANQIYQQFRNII